MPKKYMTRYSTSLSGKCKSKGQHTPDDSCLNGFHQEVRNKCDWGCVENGGLNALLVGRHIGATPMEYLLEVSLEISKRTVMWPLIPLLDIYSLLNIYGKDMT